MSLYARNELSIDAESYEPTFSKSLDPLCAQTQLHLGNALLKTFSAHTPF